MQFPSEKARKDYLRKHPKANPQDHSVKEPDAPEVSKAKSNLRSKNRELTTYLRKLDQEGITSPNSMKENDPRLKRWNGLVKEIKDLENDAGVKRAYSYDRN